MPEFKKNMTIIVLAIAVMFTFNQCFKVKDERDVILDETFDNNSREWPVGQWDGRKIEVTNGYMNIEADNSGAIVFYESTLDPKKDFYVESIIEKLSGDSLTYGLVLNQDTTTNQRYYFLIDPNRDVLICENSEANPEFTYYQPDSAFVATNVTSDTFAIEKLGQRTNFYLNRKKITTLDSIPFGGKFVEYIMWDVGNIRAHNLKIRQK